MHTVGEIAKLFGVPQWIVRRIVDGLGVEIPRAGQYRLISPSTLPQIAAELERRGWLSKTEVANES